MKYQKLQAIHYMLSSSTVLRLAVALILSLPLLPAFAKKTVAPVDTITAAKAFLLMPQQDLDLLSKSMRQDMIDYMVERDSTYKKTNVYMGLSWIERMTPDYMRVHLSDVSSLQIKLLKLSGSPLPLVMTIYTVDDGNGTADSTVKFFNNSMQQLPTSKFLSLPDPKLFFSVPKDSPVNLTELEENMPFHTMDITADPLTGSLIARLTAANGLTQEEQERFSPYLRKEFKWLWNGKKMQLQK